ncbi:hypothetical protein ACJMK2_028352 [Sinanodonta woodiana]|uniref:Uncharacterized protein n=1 Tax=Sinanodonta woodiana TaxID=1069815 RepID=A0ABD3X8C8_SINWO
MASFKCADVTPGKTIYSMKPIEKIANEFAGKQSIAYETGESNYPIVQTKTLIRHGLAATVVEAYNEHLGIELSPDDIWVAISQGVADYLGRQENAEKYRKVFVNHEGKKDLNLDVTALNILPKEYAPTKNYNRESWMKCVDGITKMIKENTKGDFAEIMVRPFSTTGVIEAQVAKGCLMEAMKMYFNYICFTKCGIPEICLLGTLADYIDMQQRVEKLSGILPDLIWWFDMVQKIVAKLIGSIQGKPDIDWWNCIVTKNRLGSGEMKQFTGWLGHLFPQTAWNTERSHRRGIQGTWECPDLKDLNYGLTYVPVTLYDLPTQKSYKLRFTFGYLGVSQNTKTKRLRPVQGWMVFYEKESSEKKE